MNDLYSQCVSIGESAISLRQVSSNVRRVHVLEVGKASEAYDPQRLVVDWEGLLAIYRLIQPRVKVLEELEAAQEAQAQRDNPPSKVRPV